MPKFLEVSNTALAKAALKLPATVYAADSGIASNGVTDVSNALKNLIEGLPSGSVLQLAAGDYYCPNLRAVEVSGDITIRGVPGKTRLVGNGSLASTYSTASNDVMLEVQAESSLRVEDVIIEDHGILVGFDNLIEAGDIEIARCNFYDSGGVVCVTSFQQGGTQSFADGMAAGRTLTFRNLRVVDCNVRSCELGVNASTMGGWEYAEISGCNFYDVGFASVFVGSQGYGPERDVEIYHPVQGPVFITNNVVRQQRDSGYTDIGGSYDLVNAFIAMGRSVFIYGNYIQDVDKTVWDDCEGIYVKAQFFDIHDNILIDAGGAEAAIAAKGGAWYARTTLAASMNGLTLPRSTLDLTSTAGFPNDNDLFAQICKVYVQTSAGWQLLTFTGKTGNTLTGVSGGTGTMSGGIVTGEPQIGNFVQPPSNPGKIHNNTIIFTKNRVGKPERGILLAVPNAMVSDNVIQGATSSAVSTYLYCPGSLITGNRVLNHKGSNVFASGASNTSFVNNTIVEYDGSYSINQQSNPNLVCFFIPQDHPELSTRDVFNVTISGNQLINSQQYGSTRFFQVNGRTDASKKMSNLVVANNTARNLFRGINVTATLTALNMVDVENDFRNDATTQPDNFFSSSTTFAAQRQGYGVPISSITSSTTLALGVGSINLGHASDTTLTRSAAGQLAVANVNVLLNGGALGTPSSGTLTNATGLPISGLVASTSAAIGVGSINLGHASDTTLTRSAAGQLAVANVNVLLNGGALGTPSSGTLTNATGLPISGLVASTSAAIGVGSINLGHATDTAIVRTSPGVITVAGCEVVRRTIQTITSATAISTTSGDQSVIINTGGLPTLGTAVGATCEIKLRNNTSAGVLIATTSSQTIDGLSTFTLPANHAVTLVPDNGNWSVF